MSQVSILVITHKMYEFPHSAIYHPLFVGGKCGQNSVRFLMDNTGKHISEKNPSFCELTGLYWAWKNQFFCNSKYIGLVHYRRYFRGNGEKLKGKIILSEKEILDLLKEYDCIVPKKRNYFIESIYSHYQHAHHVKDLNCTREIISELHPEYITSFDAIMQGRKIHIYNMFVMSSEKASEYCKWLFPILFELEKRIDITQYDSYQKRVFGFIAERLFNVWLVYHQLTFCEIPVVNLEGENLLKKAINLLKRKFLR